MNAERLKKARSEYSLQVACMQAGLGGNPVSGMMEKGYTEEEAKFVADEYRKQFDV